jgi:hypothetical protein
MSETTGPDLSGEYGVIANVLEGDPVFRHGAKVWLVGGDNGDGFESRQFYGLGKGSRRGITKWARTIRMYNYRCAWIPPPMQPRVETCRGTRAEVEAWAAEIDALTQERRKAKELVAVESDV